MRLLNVTPRIDGILYIEADDGRRGIFDVGSYLSGPVFQALRDWDEFKEVENGGYFVTWRCGADLSADTIEAKWIQDSQADAQQSSGFDATQQRKSA